METQIQFFPDTLVHSQFNSLTRYLDRAASLTPDELLAEADRHVHAAADAYRKNRLVNLRLAMAIRDVIKKLTTSWDDQPDVARPWLAAAILYFSQSNDDEPDLDSAIGFEDDVEVLNACLRFADQHDLCLNPEDYDSV